MISKQRRDTLVGLGFLAPNILGFLTFTLGPLVFSLFLAFTNWDLRLHNMFKEEELQIVFFENFIRLFKDPDFWKYLGNTLFLMMGIPFAIAGSLFAAILLSKDTRGGNDWVWKRLVATAGLIFGLGCLVMVGTEATAMTLLVGGMTGLILVGGTLGGTTVYRTLFFMPHFTSGVATFILWKKLYNPSTGPITNSLRPLLDSIGVTVQALPASGVQGSAWICSGLMLALFFLGIWKFQAAWKDGEMGWSTILISMTFSSLPPLFATRWAFGDSGLIVASCALAILLFGVGRIVVRGQDFSCRSDAGLGSGLMLGAMLMVAQFILLGLGNVLYGLPSQAADGLEPPEWLTQYDWAKPSIMLMGLWAAIGSNNMLLYLAGLTSIPGELYEAADIDGASSFQRFWHVTWPQLAPVTFFITIMSVIGGLQGGFEMARVMTQGGPAGSTTTLSYFVYNEGFTTGRLGYAAGISWAMFMLVFAVTLFNWKFGNRQVND